MKQGPNRSTQGAIAVHGQLFLFPKGRPLKCHRVYWSRQQVYICRRASPFHMDAPPQTPPFWTTLSDGRMRAYSARASRLRRIVSRRDNRPFNLSLRRTHSPHALWSRPAPSASSLPGSNRDRILPDPERSQVVLCLYTFKFNTAGSQATHWQAADRRLETSSPLDLQLPSLALMSLRHEVSQYQRRRGRRRQLSP